MYTEGTNVTKCTASLEFSDVSLQSNKELKIGGDHFLPPPYETTVPASAKLVVAKKSLPEPEYFFIGKPCSSLPSGGLPT